MTGSSGSANARRGARGSGDGRAIAGNVIANWIWYAVVMVMGFLLPRLVDRYHGRELLGIWDFAWSLVAYISFLAFGVTSAVNRYVARYRTSRDWGGLNDVINSSLGLLCAGGILGLALAGLFSLLVPHLLPNSSPPAIAAARAIVLILAAKSALQIPGGVFNGIITGFERFDLLNIIRVSRDCGIMLASLAALLTGFGIVSIALCFLVGELLGEVAKFIVARRLCSNLRFSTAHIRWTTIKKMLSFGGKTLLQSVAQGGIYQGSSLLVGYFLGAPTLAIYSRQRALVMHAMQFVKQYAQVFLPRSSTHDATGDVSALQHTLVQSSKFGLYIALPIILLLLIMGDSLLWLWMGQDYAAPLVLAVMAGGHLLYIAQLGVYSILMGMGRHGVPAVFDSLAAVLSVLLGVLILGPWKGGMVGAAIAMTLPVAVSGGVLLPLYACRTLGMPIRHYVAQVAPQPILLAIPFAACLLLARLWCAAEPIQALFVGVSTGGPLLAMMYFRWALPAPARARLLARLQVSTRSS